jgi:hypothetical protein
MAVDGGASFIDRFNGARLGRPPGQAALGGEGVKHLAGRGLARGRLALAVDSSGHQARSQQSGGADKDAAKERWGHESESEKNGS